MISDKRPPSQLKTISRCVLLALTSLMVLMDLYLIFLHSFEAGILFFFGSTFQIGVLFTAWTLYVTIDSTYSVLRAGWGSTMLQKTVYFLTLIGVIAWIIPVVLAAKVMYDNGFHNNYLPLILGILSLALALMINWGIFFHKKGILTGETVKGNWKALD